VSKSFTKKSQQQWPNLELVSLVAYATKAIAEAKGYLTYPKEKGVELVLQGLYIVNMAVKVKEKQASRETKNLKQSMEQ